MKSLKYSLTPILFGLFLPSAVFADGIITGILPEGPNTTIPILIKTILNFAIGFAVVVCVAILIFAGYSYMTANGDENKIKKATTSLTWAIIGLVVCFVAILLVRFVGEKIGIGFGV